MQIETQNVFEIGKSVVAAKAHVIAEERQHQGIGERLRDDRKIHAGDPRPECKPPERKCQQSRHEHHHQQGEPRNG